MGVAVLGLSPERVDETPRRALGEARPPRAISVAGGVFVVAVAAGAASLAHPAESGLRYVWLLGAVALFSGLARDALASIWVALIGVLVFNGFVLNGEGQLSWHGLDDLWRLAAVVAAIPVGRIVGTVVRR